MNKADTVIRYVAFSFSVALYFVLLPIILSYSLGYHIDFRNLNIYKTGMLSLRSTPSGASLYINGRSCADLTPARIEELKPGTYSIEVKREGFYPWQKEVTIRPNMVTRAENIILFPITQEMEKVGDYEAASFIITDDKRQIYYMTKSGLYRSSIDGTNPRKLSSYPDWPEKISDKKFSPDGKKFLYFNEHGIWMVYLNTESYTNSNGPARVEEILKTPLLIHDVFWHSGSNHLVFVAGREINVLDLGGDSEKNIVTLYRCNKMPSSLYYDNNNDSLYFNDSYEGKPHLYRMDLREKLFNKLMQRVKKEFDIIYEKR